MTISVLGESDSQTFDEVVDLASMKYGNQDGLTFCGTRSYEILDLQDRHSNYLEFQDLTLTSQSLDDADIGEYLI